MKKNKKEAVSSSPYMYFTKAEETVYRTDETQKQAIIKKLKLKRAKKRALSVISFILAFTVLISGFYVGKKGIEKFLVLRQEEQTHLNALIPDNIKKKLKNMSEEEKWAYLYEQYPELIDVKFPAGILFDYALYYAKNPQTIGYLKIDGTKIDTPVVQADNDKYYLRHDFNGKSTSYGAVFATYKANFKPFDRNTLIYGHNMFDGERFAALANYKSLDYFKKHPVIHFDTLFEKHDWKIYAVILTNGSTKSNDGYFFDFTFNNCSDTCFEEYIKEIDKRKLYDTGVDLLPTDKLITLCTCTYEFDDARLIVIARMVRENESAEVNTKLADFKDTPVKYPDLFYDNPKDNPYKDDPKFYLY